MRLAIVGYGNLGKSLEKEIDKHAELTLTAIYSRRNLDCAKYRPLKTIAEAHDFDVALLALGSYNDIVEYTPLFTQLDTVDSYDTHANIAEYKKELNQTKKNNLSIVSTGWDPGLLSLARGVFSIGGGESVTLWGEGISQGHSNALRSIRGVIDAVQFTQPKADAEQNIANGQRNSGKLHNRICYVACVSSDKKRIENEIATMPNYFDGYDTKVIFTTPQQIRELKKNTAHRGQVVCVGDGFNVKTDVKLNCNTDYTAKIMLDYANAIPQLKSDGYRGALDVYDIPLKYLASNSLI